VKEEMLEQVHSLDLIYEKETTQKLLEFKLKYLVSYATLMRNYFMHMNFSDIVTELSAKENPKARQILLIAAMTVSPSALNFPNKIEDITEEIIE
jgi:deoxyadenosine/deoxycytidine kinase|tara:strand:+ start:32 stop:316 length:285 start_codon:yes stop_codon:yes gene_type:complete